MGDDERESNNSDQIQRIYTPGKDNKFKGRSFATSCSSSLSLAQSVTRSISFNRKANKGKFHRAFADEVRKVINQSKWGRMRSSQEDLTF